MTRVLGIVKWTRRYARTRCPPTKETNQSGTIIFWSVITVPRIFYYSYQCWGFPLQQPILVVCILVLLCIYLALHTDIVELIRYNLFFNFKVVSMGVTKSPYWIKTIDWIIVWWYLHSLTSRNRFLFSVLSLKFQ